MSGARAQVIDDDDVDDIPLTPGPGAGQPAAREQQQNVGGDQDYEIIEVPDDFQSGADTQAGGGQEVHDGGQQANETQQQRTDRSAGKLSGAQRRQLHKQARENTLSENRQLRAELAEIRERLETGIEPRMQAYDEGRARQNMEAIDRQIADATARTARAKRTMSEAMIAQDAEAFNTALDERDAAFIEAQQLTARKQIIERTGQDPMAPGRQDGQGQPRRQADAQSQAPAPLPRAARELMSDFQNRHDWINPAKDRAGNFTDDDTAILMRIDHAVARDGFNPSTQEYWDELEDRAARYLPHRFAADNQPAPARHNGQRMANGGQPARVAPERRGPMVGAGNNGQGPRPGAQQVHLTSGRKMALIQAGVLADDGRTIQNPVKFKQYLAGYEKYDRANGVARQ